MNAPVAMIEHWAVQYIGLPWVSGGQGPRSFNCWGFFRHVQAAHFDCFVPIVDIDALSLRAVIAALNGHEERRNWQQVAVPQEGDAVLMSRGSNKASHIGVWCAANGGGVLHCAQGYGVVLQNRLAMALSGWSKRTYWRHV